MRCIIGQGSSADQDGAVVEDYATAVYQLCRMIEGDARRSAHRMTVAAREAIAQVHAYAVFEADINVTASNRSYYILTLDA